MMKHFSQEKIPLRFLQEVLTVAKFGWSQAQTHTSVTYWGLVQEMLSLEDLPQKEEVGILEALAEVSEACACSPTLLWLFGD